MKNKLKILKEYIKGIIKNSLNEAPIVPPSPPNNQPQEPNQNQQQPQQQNPQPPPQPQQPQQNNPNVERVGYVTTDQAAALIRGTKGKIFTVTFIKRSNKQRRVMNARLGVKAYLHHGALPYDPNEKGLIPCFDMQKREYRMISIDGIEEVKIGNYTFKVGNNPNPNPTPQPQPPTPPTNPQPIQEIKIQGKFPIKDFNNIYEINIVCDDSYDNNIWIRAKNEKEALEEAILYIQAGEEITEKFILGKISEDNEVKENFNEHYQELLEGKYPDPEEFKEFLLGKTDGYCYSSGS